MVIMAVPVKDVFGDFRGILIAEVNLKFMWDLVESLKIGKTGLAYVVNRQGKLIAFGDIARVLRGENAGNLKVVHEFINNVAPVDEAKAKVFTGINGATVLGTSVSLGMPDWAVVTELPVAEAYEQVIQTISIMAIFTLIMAATAGWVGVYLARRLAVPIVHLMETATRIAGGEMGLRAKIGGTTEITGLAVAFNSMTDQLREVIGSLERRSRHLQSTVQEYVEYMIEVGNGKLGSRLELKEREGQSDDPLIILGRQLNETTASLQQLVEQIQEATDILKKREAELKQEISERKQAEALLKESLSLKRATLESTADGILVVDGQGKVVDFNNKFMELWGLPPDLMEQKDDNRLLERVLSHLKDPESFVHKVIELYDKPDAEDFDEVQFKDGRIFERYSIPHRLEGKSVGRVWSFRDVTERKQAEERLKKYSEELKQSNEDVLSFAYIVSHDLRAPLVSIKGFTGELQHALREIESALDRCMPHLGEQDRSRITAAYRSDVPEAMKFINASVSRMDGLINAILTLSRLGHRELKPEPIDMGELAKSILSSLAHQIEQRKTTVTIGELPAVTADKIAMEQIMGNLLDNALKYLDPDRDGEIAITAERGVDETAFHVRDNGRGIAADDVQKAFEIFRRVGAQDTPGEGMGLAHVKTLVRRHGGRIWCKSESGVGSTFSFTIPQNREETENRG